MKVGKADAQRGLWISVGAALAAGLLAVAWGVLRPQQLSTNDAPNRKLAASPASQGTLSFVPAEAPAAALEPSSAPELPPAVATSRIPEACNNKFGAVFSTLGSTLEDRGEGLEFSMEMELEAARPLQGLGFGFKLLVPAGEMVIDQPDTLTRFYFAPVAGTQKAVLSVPRIGQFLNGGHYRVDCWIGLAQTEYAVQLQDVAVFELPAVDLYGTGKAAEARKHGHTAVKAVWNCWAEEKGGG